MAKVSQRITNCLWFDSEAEEAANFYTSIFKNSHIRTITRYTEEGFEFHGKPKGSVMTVSFVLDGQELLALNGGPIFKFNEAFSMIINCENQEEIDHFWYGLSAGGQESQCGWLKDKFGVSWQVVSAGWANMISGPDPAKTARVLAAMFQMKKPELDVLQRAYDVE